MKNYIKCPECPVMLKDPKYTIDLFCTRLKGHTGPHHAHGSEVCYQIEPQEDSAK